MTDKSTRSFYKCLIVLVAALVTTSASATTISLDFNSLPSAQGWSYPEAVAIETDVYSVDGTTLTMDSIGKGPVDPNYVQLGVTNSVDPFTISFQSRVLAEEIDVFGPGQALFFGVVIDNLSYSFIYGPDYYRVGDGAGAGGPFSFPVPNFGAAFHDFVLAGTPGTSAYTVSVDGGSYVFNGFANPTGGVDQLVFGDGSTTGNGFAEITAYTFAQVPEPSTALLVGFGLAGLAANRRRR